MGANLIFNKNTSMKFDFFDINIRPVDFKEHIQSILKRIILFFNKNPDFLED